MSYTIGTLGDIFPEIYWKYLDKNKNQWNNKINGILAIG
jgi:hypothetical protein